jgi:hypothetical protein
MPAPPSPPREPADGQRTAYISRAPQLPFEYAGGAIHPDPDGGSGDDGNVPWSSDGLRNSPTIPVVAASSGRMLGREKVAAHSLSSVTVGHVRGRGPRSSALTAFTARSFPAAAAAAAASESALLRPSAAPAAGVPKKSAASAQGGTLGAHVAAEPAAVSRTLQHLVQALPPPPPPPARPTTRVIMSVKRDGDGRSARPPQHVVTETLPPWLQAAEKDEGPVRRVTASTDPGRQAARCATCQHSRSPGRHSFGSQCGTGTCRVASLSLTESATM